MHAAAKALHGIAVFSASTGLERLLAEAGRAQGIASAEVVSSLTVNPRSDLEFGGIASSSIAGTVTVSSGGTATVSGGSRIVCCKPSQAARFAVQGETGRAYTVSIPTSVIARGNAKGTSGAAPPDLVVAGLTVRTDSRPDAGPSGVLDSAGKDGFSIGGTLYVPGNVPPSDYKATVPVIVNYS